jgi:hypothetical protein
LPQIKTVAKATAKNALIGFINVYYIMIMSPMRKPVLVLCNELSSPSVLSRAPAPPHLF